MRRTRSFTMIEILTVLVIVSILAGIVLTVAKFAKQKAHQTKTLAKMRALENGLDNCRGDRGYFPLTDSNGIIQLGDHSDLSSYDPLSDMAADWDLQKGEFRNTQSNRAYLDGYEGGKYLDAWGRPFLYRCDGNQHNKQTFDLFSVGRDGQVGTDDDVTNWQKN